MTVLHFIRDHWVRPDRAHRPQGGGKQPVALAVRFWAKVDQSPAAPNGCWLWTAHTNSNGYGEIGEGGKHGKHLLAHRVSWEIANGPIPAGMGVCHKCDTPPCVRPGHLFLGTQADNAADREAKGRGRNVIADAMRAKTHCPLGHEYTQENTYLRSRGSRECRACWKINNRRAYAKQAAARRSA